MFLNGVVDDHELLYPLQYGHTPLHLAADEGHATCVEHLLSTPGIDVDTAFQTISFRNYVVVCDEWCDDDDDD